MPGVVQNITTFENLREFDMINLVESLAIVASGIILLNSAAWAQDADPGKSEFQSSCATCHGIDGEGKGPLSPQLKAAPADLTVLAKKNNGVLPFETIYEVIDGRKEVAAHGTRDMPIWGNRFGPNVAQTFIVPGFDPETMIRMRILTLIDYLNRFRRIVLHSFASVGLGRASVRPHPSYLP